MKVVEGSSLFADISGFPSTSIITGDALRPDLLLKTNDNCFYILELTIGFEINLSNNAERKLLKYSRLVSDLRSQYKSVTFVNLSTSSLGVYANSWKVVEGSSLFADISGFPSTSIITGDALRPDLLLKTNDNCFYILELTIGFEINLSNNAERKLLKYSRLVSDLRSQYKSVTFVNLSTSSLGVYANSWKVVEGSSLFADISGFPSTSIITGDALRPDLLLKTNDNCFYILELTIGFEINLSNNAERKLLKYSRLVSDLRSQYKSVTFVNLSMSSLGVYANSCLSFLKMCDSLSIDNQHKRFLISKLSTISIRTTYYIFCCRDKPWNNPDLLCF